MDKYGRKVQRSGADDMEKFYARDDDDEDEGHDVEGSDASKSGGEKYAACLPACLNTRGD